MGEAVADAIAQHPDHVVVHVVGGFHVLHRDGTVAQTLRRAPKADCRVVSVRPTFDLPQTDGDGLTPEVADYVIYAAGRASDRNEGRWSVEIGGSLRYKIHLPAGASDAAPVPLVIWLGDDGVRDTDGLSYWKLGLGNEYAIVSLDPPFLGEGEDLTLGGRWYWMQTFSADADRIGRGIERVIDYVGRRFPVDTARVVVAGEGTGATVVLTSALYNSGAPWTGVVLAPRKTGRLRFGGLPGKAPATLSVTILAPPLSRAAIEALAGDHEKVGLPTTVTPVEADPVAGAIALELAIAAAFRPRTVPALYTAVELLELRADTPTARRWARTLARKRWEPGQRWVALTTRARAAADIQARQRGKPVVSVRRLDIVATRVEVSGPVSMTTAWTVADCATAIPAAPGPFGGTTIVVVLPGTDGATAQAWLDLAGQKPLQKRSRFHRMVVADAERGTGLAQTLAKLKETRRTNVLIVPATFCATPEQMRQLRAAAGDQLEGMTVAWLPGLGGRLAAAR
jgi:hypothetical protein